jgi:uncharacterized protein YyaL (SSP411 family)
MNRRRQCICILFLILIFLPGLVVAGQKSPGPVKWYPYKKGIAVAKQEGKPVFLHFFTDWCQYCKEMQAKTFANPQVAGYLNQNFIAIRVNTDTEGIIATQYEVRPIPDNVFLNPEGQRLRHVLGYYDADNFMNVLRNIQVSLASAK